MWWDKGLVKIAVNSSKELECVKALSLGELFVTEYEALAVQGAVNCLSFK